jgi:hypothetical protein
MNEDQVLIYVTNRLNGVEWPRPHEFKIQANSAKSHISPEVLYTIYCFFNITVDSRARVYCWSFAVPEQDFRSRALDLINHKLDIIIDEATAMQKCSDEELTTLWYSIPSDLCPSWRHFGTLSGDERENVVNLYKMVNRGKMLAS